MLMSAPFKIVRAGSRVAYCLRERGCTVDARPGSLYITKYSAYLQIASAHTSSRAKSLTGARPTIRVTREGPLAFHKRPGEAKAASPLGISTKRIGRALRKRNGGPVASGADGEHARCGIRRVHVSRPARRRRRNRGHERTSNLALTVGHRGRQGGEAAGAARRHHTHMGTIDRGSRGERAGVGLGLGDTGALLHVRVQRDGDGSENADDRHDDQELDQREAALTAQREAFPEHAHVLPPSRWFAQVRASLTVCGKENAQWMPGQDCSTLPNITGIYR